MKRLAWLDFCAAAVLAIVLCGCWAFKLAMWDVAEFGIAPGTLEFAGSGGGWTAGLLYPFRMLDALELSPPGVGVFEAVHVFAAGLFMYVLVRVFGCGRMAGVCAGIVFMLNGAVLSSAVDPAFLAGFCYVPIVFAMVHCTLTRPGLQWPVAAGFALAFQMLTGCGQVVLYTVNAAGIYALVELTGGYAIQRKWPAMRHTVGKLAMAAAVGVSLAAPQVWLWMDGRAGETEVVREIAATFSVQRGPGPSLGATVRAMLDPVPAAGLHYQYLGLSSLMLAAAATFSSIKKRRVAAVAACGLAGLLMSSGVDSRLYRILGALSAGDYDSPARLLVIWTFAVALLAGFGYDYFDATSRTHRTHRRRMEMGLVCIAGLLLALRVRPTGQLYIVLLMFGISALFTATNDTIRKTAQIVIMVVVLVDLSGAIAFLPGPEGEILGPDEVAERVEKVPRAFVVDHYEVATGVREIRDRVSDPEFDPRVSVVLESAPDFEPAEDPGDAVAAFVDVTALEQTVITTPELARPALLVMTDKRFPGGYTVTVDGSQVSPRTANHIHQAVALGPGPHTVTIDHALRAWRSGRWISAVTLAILLAAWAVRARRRASKNGGETPDEEVAEPAEG